MNRKKVLIPIIIFTALVIFLIVVLNPSKKYNNMAVSQEKWDSIKNTRNEENVIILYLTRKKNWCIFQHVAKAVWLCLPYHHGAEPSGPVFLRSDRLWQRSGGKQNEEAV